MPVIVVTQPSDGTTADVADVNNQINAILAVVNGHLDQDNIADGGIPNSKLAGGITIDKLASSTLQGWGALSQAPSAVVANGNRSYSLTFSAIDFTSLLSPGMRLKLTRTVAAPVQCASLNGTTQFFSKSSPAGMTFTDGFVVSGWFKLNSYGTTYDLISRYNGTSGFVLRVSSTGTVQLIGFNTGAGNNSYVESLHCVPFGRWVHITAQLDMLSFTASPTTSYVMLDGVDVPARVARGGTNPTALVQAGNLEIGSSNGGTNPLSGKVAQVAIYNAKVTQATARASIGQSLAGTETSLVSAYTLSNSLNDLNANANNLTPNGSAIATNTDAPFAQAATAGVLEYGVVTAVAFSTNTTVTVQVPEGSALPSSGGLSAVAYSSVQVPYLWPDMTKFKLSVLDGALGATLAKYVIPDPIDGVRFINTDTGGGSMLCFLRGYEKKILILAAPQATSAAGSSYSAALPSFLASAQSAMASGTPGGDARGYAVVNGFSTSAYSFYLTNPAGAFTFTCMGQLIGI